LRQGGVGTGGGADVVAGGGAAVHGSGGVVVAVGGGGGGGGGGASRCALPLLVSPMCDSTAAGSVPSTPTGAATPEPTHTPSRPRAISSHGGGDVAPRRTRDAASMSPRVPASTSTPTLLDGMPTAQSQPQPHGHGHAHAQVQAGSHVAAGGGGTSRRVAGGERVLTPSTSRTGVSRGSDGAESAASLAGGEDVAAASNGHGHVHGHGGHGSSHAHGHHGSHHGHTHSHRRPRLPRPTSSRPRAASSDGHTVALEVSTVTSHLQLVSTTSATAPGSAATALASVASPEHGRKLIAGLGVVK
jgi:hypothetical protein